MAATAKKTETQQPGEAIREQIRAEREAISALQADRDELENGYLPFTDIQKNISTWLDRQSAAFTGEYLLNPILRNNGRPIDCNLLEVGTRPGAYAHNVDLAPLLAFLFADEIKTRLAEFVQTLDVPDGPPAADRPALIKKLDAKIRVHEIREEQLIVEAENAGINVLRHPDASPAVILEWTGGD